MADKAVAGWGKPITRTSAQNTACPSCGHMESITVHGARCPRCGARKWRREAERGTSAVQGTAASGKMHPFPQRSFHEQRGIASRSFDRHSEAAHQVLTADRSCRRRASF